MKKLTALFCATAMVLSLSANVMGASYSTILPESIVVSQETIASLPDGFTGLAAAELKADDYSDPVAKELATALADPNCTSDKVFEVLGIDVTEEMAASDGSTVSLEGRDMVAPASEMCATNDAGEKSYELKGELDAEMTLEAAKGDETFADGVALVVDPTNPTRKYAAKFSDFVASTGAFKVKFKDHLGIMMWFGAQK